jgi:hypothetical protein
MKHSFVLLSIALLSFFAPAASSAQVPAEDKSEVKEHLQNHFKFYGFIRNYFTYDSRESKSGTGNLFYYLPLDQKLNALDQDLNAQSSFRFLALTSRVGVDVSGYYINNIHFGAKIEADFYSGLSGSTGTATLRMRQAYATVTWKELGNEKKNTVGMKIGQAWHPMAADHPHVFSLEVGAPFGPFSRTPQVTMDASFGKNWILTASALWQMQYTSSGPAGSSADYMKYGCTPEIYAGLTYKSNGFLMRAGADMVSLKPRVQGNAVIDGKAATVKVNDRITTVSAFAYAQYDYKKFSVKAKTTYGSAGEHMNLMSGYAKIGAGLEDGTWEYAPLHSSSSWLSLSYGKKWKGVLFLGYMKNLGLSNGVLDRDLAVSDVYFNKNGFANINQMYRINPEIVYTFGKFVIGLEWQYTAVQYGSYKKVDGVDHLNERGLATDNLHWIGNHRVQSMVRFNF